MIYTLFSQPQSAQSQDSIPIQTIQPFTCRQQNYLNLTQPKYKQKPSRNSKLQSKKSKTTKLSQKQNQQEDDFQKLLQKIEKVKQQYENDQKTLNFNQSILKQPLSFKKKTKSNPQSPQIIKYSPKMKTLKGTQSIFCPAQENYYLNKTYPANNTISEKSFQFDTINETQKQNIFQKKNVSNQFQPFSYLFSETKENLNYKNISPIKEQNKLEFKQFQVKKKIFIDTKILQKIPVRQSINFDQEILSFQQNNLNFLESSKREELKFSDFQIGSCIGSGKFGQVYICKHKKTNFICALKKILKSTIEEYKMVDQLARELKISYMVDHPNIVKTYGHFHDEFHVFILMEYAGDGSVIDDLQHKKSEQLSSKVLFQTLNAVDHLHKLNIVHRDIKPQNIVVFFKDTFKLCDFGLSAFVQNDMKHTFCGTPDYVSPQMKDVGEYDLSVDLWSLGVLAFQLIVGEAPFKDKISQWKKSGWKKSSYWTWKVEYPSGISQIAKSFMQTLLKQKPKQRANLIQCLRHQFIKGNNKKQASIIKAAQVSGF